ncbi:hypothetical protein Efla_006851 [Eimeria flavescens]
MVPTGQAAAAHSSLPSGHHFPLSHPSSGIHEVLEALAAAMHRLTLKEQPFTAPPRRLDFFQVSFAPKICPVERSFNRHPKAPLWASANRQCFVTVQSGFRFDVKPHCRVALTRLRQLRSKDNLALDEIEEACIREDEAGFVRGSSSRAPVYQHKPQQTQQQSAGSRRPCPICGEPHM